MISEILGHIVNPWTLLIMTIILVYRSDISEIVRRFTVDNFEIKYKDFIFKFVESNKDRILKKLPDIEPEQMKMITGLRDIDKNLIGKENLQKVADVIKNDFNAFEIGRFCTLFSDDKDLILKEHSNEHDLLVKMKGYNIVTMKRTAQFGRKPNLEWTLTDLGQLLIKIFTPDFNSLP